MSLDGFIAGRNDAMDWVFGYAPLDSPEIRTMIEAFSRSTGSVLSGRRSYNVGRKPGQRPEARKVMGGAWSGPIFVLTHNAPEDETDPSIRFRASDIRSAVGVARDAGGGKDVIVIGADVARQCIQGRSYRRDSRESCARVARRWDSVLQVAGRAGGCSSGTN
jgi:dihydrofolate reductase